MSLRFASIISQALQEDWDKKPLEAEVDLWDEGRMQCLAHMTQWGDLEAVAKQGLKKEEDVSLDTIWDDPFYIVSWETGWLNAGKGWHDGWQNIGKGWNDGWLNAGKGWYDGWLNIGKGWHDCGRTLGRGGMTAAEHWEGVA